MIARSTRLVLPALALLVIAALPVFVHQGERRLEDCRDPEALLAMAPPQRHPQMTLTHAVDHTFSPYDVYGRPHGSPMQATYPESRVGLRELEAEDGVRLPVHWSFDSSPTASRVRAYLYVHGGEPVRHPFVSGLALAPSQLVHGTRPVSRFVIDGLAYAGNDAELARIAEDWIRSAWLHHRKSCQP